MNADDRLGLFAGFPERVPERRRKRFEAELSRELGEGDRLAATSGVPSDLGRRDLGVVEPRDLTGDQPVGIRARPHLDVPVVPGLDRGERKLLVREALEADSGEADERGEVQRRVDAIDVHVGDPFVHVVGASTDHFEPRRLDEDAVLLLPGDSVDRDLRQHGAVEHPGVIAIGRLHHAGRAVGELRRHTSFEHVGWLNQVIVDRDDRVPPGPTGRTVTDLRNP